MASKNEPFLNYLEHFLRPDYPSPSWESNKMEEEKDGTISPDVSGVL